MGEIGVGIDNPGIPIKTVFEGKGVSSLVDAKPIIDTTDSSVFVGEGHGAAPRLRDLIEHHVQTSSDELSFPQFSDAQIRSLSPEDYADYLDLASYTLKPAEHYARNIQVIADRLESDCRTLADTDFRLAVRIGSYTGRVVHELALDNSVSISPEIVQRLYSYTSNEHPLVRDMAAEYVESLFFVDRRNQQNGQGYVGVMEQYEQDVLQKLLHPKNDTDADIGQTLVRSVINHNDFDLLLTGLRQADSKEGIQRLYSAVTNKIGLERVRKLLRSYTTEHPDFKPILDRTEQALGFDKSETPEADLRELYTKIGDEFAQYKPNEELLKYETTLLTHEFRNASRVLDIGHGPAARHMNALERAGIRVFGFDFVDSLVQIAKKANPNLQTSIADWHHMPFADGSFDGVYCLGRSLLHNTTISDWEKTFSEMRRVLGDNIPGKGKKFAIVDKPVLTQGNYKTENERFGRTADNLHLYNRETGNIHDAPDNEHAFDRLTLTDRQFIAAGRLAGFSVSRISRQEYADIQGNTDVNVYWKLTVRDKPLTPKEVIRCVNDLHTGGSVGVVRVYPPNQEPQTLEF